MTTMQPNDPGPRLTGPWPGKRNPACGNGLGLRVSRQFQASDMATRDALIAITGKLRARQVSFAALDTLELVLAEILNNITEHAYGGSGGSVDLSVSVFADGLRCRIADQGKRAPETVLAGGSLPQPLDMPEGGWGWYLVTTLSEDVTYQQENGWNILRLTVPWDT